MASEHLLGRAEGYTIDDEYETRYLAFLDKLQSKQSGYWGAQYHYQPERNHKHFAAVVDVKPSGLWNGPRGANNRADTAGQANFGRNNSSSNNGSLTGASLATNLGVAIASDSPSEGSPANADGWSTIATDDLSMTFHITKYRGGAVRIREQLAKTTLAIRNSPYPYGWGWSTENGTTVYDNHNSFDVATLLSLTWRSLITSMDLASAQAGMSEMLAFAVGHHSLAPGGSALICEGESSLGDCYYFTLGLMDVAGYWNTSHRFWTNQTAPFADAARLCVTLSAAMARLHLKTGIGGSAVQILRPYC
jgi:hypothetical protein